MANCCLQSQCRDHALHAAFRKVGAEVFCLCSGHGERPFSVWLKPTKITLLLQLGEVANRRGWNAEVLHGLFRLKSQKTGEEAEKQAALMAENLASPLLEVPQWRKRGPEEYRSFESFLTDPLREEECVPLVLAMNKLPDLETFCSSCGYGIHVFKIWFRTGQVDSLHRVAEAANRLGWEVTVPSNCADLFLLSSGNKGEEAYLQAGKIAEFLQSSSA